MPQSLLDHPLAIWTLVVFALSYGLVLLEEKLSLLKSKPVIVGGSLIWGMVAIIVLRQGGDTHALHAAAQETFAEYGGLLLFLLVAMTYIAALSERGVFDALRSRLVAARLSFRQLLWVTGLLAFFISPFADNMTTALVMGTIVMSLTADTPRIVPLFMVNIVNAANAGGVWSPFGDITTLMVWQSGKMAFFDFLVLFAPSFICFLIPAAILTFFVPKAVPEADTQTIRMKEGGKRMIALGIFTIVLAVCFEQVLHLPSALGMMLGLGILLLFGHFLRRNLKKQNTEYDVFSLLHHTEWDTLLFFFGVIFAISGLAFLGYLEKASLALYGGMGADFTNVVLGVISALVDNIPLMFAVLKMDPDMARFQWELITLTLGIGGSLLAVGSAAGVALMGVGRGSYGFMSHLKWTPALALGYAGAILTHYLINSPG